MSLLIFPLLFLPLEDSITRLSLDSETLMLDFSESEIVGKNLRYPFVDFHHNSPQWTLLRLTTWLIKSHGQRTARLPRPMTSQIKAQEKILEDWKRERDRQSQFRLRGHSELSLKKDNFPLTPTGKSPAREKECTLYVYSCVRSLDGYGGVEIT